MPGIWLRHVVAVFAAAGLVCSQRASAQSSPAGDWEITSKGEGQTYIGIYTLTDSNTISGYGIRTGTNDLSTVTGTWAHGSKEGLITASISVIVDGITYLASVNAMVKPGVSIRGKTYYDDGSTETFSGIPVGAAPVITGNFLAAGKIGMEDFSQAYASAPDLAHLHVYDLASRVTTAAADQGARGTADSAVAMVDTKARVYVILNYQDVLQGRTPIVLAGKYNAAKGLATLKGRRGSTRGSLKLTKQ